MVDFWATLHIRTRSCTHLGNSPHNIDLLHLFNTAQCRFVSTSTVIYANALQNCHFFSLDCKMWLNCLDLFNLM